MRLLDQSKSLFGCMNKMASTFSDDSAVRLADTVQPCSCVARWQRWMPEWQTVAAPVPVAWETAFAPTTGEYILI